MDNKKYFYGKELKIQSVQSMDFIKHVDTKFAEHMYHRNRVIEAFAMSELGGVDVLSQPVCKKCEKPGWNTTNPSFKTSGDPEKDREVRNCYCYACGATSYHTLTVRQYLIEQMNVQEGEIENLENKVYGGH